MVRVCRTLNIWNQVNSHPLFAESDARYHSIALAKMRKLFFLVMLTTVVSAVGKFKAASNYWGGYG